MQAAAGHWEVTNNEAQFNQSKNQYLHQTKMIKYISSLAGSYVTRLMALKAKMSSSLVIWPTWDNTFDVI